MTYKLEYTKTYEVDEKFLQDCADYLHMWIPFKLTLDQIWGFFKEEPELLKSSVDIGFDTGEREWFMGLLAKKLIGVDWPTNGESGDPKFANFHERLIEAGKAAGYEVQ
jgi:hypothetical protein